MSEWTHGPNGFELHVQVPANTTALVYVPLTSRSLSDIQEDGRPAWVGGRFTGKRPGVESAYRKGPDVVFKVGSGNYRFKTVRGAVVEP